MCEIGKSGFPETLKPLGMKTKKWDGKGAGVSESGSSGQGNKAWWDC